MSNAVNVSPRADAGTGQGAGGQQPRRPGDRSTALTRRTALVPEWYLRVVGLLNLLTAVSFTLREQVHSHNTGDLYTPFMLFAGFTSAAAALFMAMMLGRRKRVAWIVVTLLCGLYAVLSVWALTFDDLRRHPFNWISTAVTCLVLVCTLIGRREFYAKGDRTNPQLALAVLGVGALISVGAGATLVTAAGPDHASIGDRVWYVALRLTALTNDQDFQALHVNHWVGAGINLTGLLLFLAVLYALFRSPRGREQLGRDDEEQLRTLLAKHGARDSLGYFALRRDKAVIFSPTGKAAVTYRVVGGVTLASGDPIGDVEAWPGAIDAWLAEAREHAWIPAVMGASEEGGTVYARHGLDALELGDEAIVETGEFTLDGRAMRGVRQAYNRVKRAGYTTRIRRHHDIPADEMAELLAAADRWRDGQTERGFSMALGRLGDPADGDCVMIECHDGEGELRALLSFVPWGPKGLSLDLMRRDRSSENGLVEFMVLELIQQADSVDVQRISLNFAMFRSVFEEGARLGAGPVLRLWRSALMFFSRWWQLESLYRANAKYRPIWEPRFLLFEKSSQLPRIGLASARAEGFIVAPAPLSRLRRDA
ncbi:phosphatidylglycerol lysyltransferase domain-containing protein [Streptomyces sp. PTM05]|uniref:Phosphatidylglycerol lysyltransferase domain-containing protein n=1 Tax=Streptantibioticus parmotrematis TaxID=2873249 RepID=A0ABS7QNI0_9ACTN|nr:phosphatidylglycerol lysyltransferase domain-containing protein [Streptantibioticus parmotrematis]MBY8884508.1 phosphatidylglycerol lysyltransferase domain-containing protein [Streptantibioticus parmotrematis]